MPCLLCFKGVDPTLPCFGKYTMLYHLFEPLCISSWLKRVFLVHLDKMWRRGVPDKKYVKQLCLTSWGCDNRIILVTQMFLWNRRKNWALKNSPLVTWRCTGPPASTSQRSLSSTSCRGGGTLASSPARTLPPPGRWLPRLVQMNQNCTRCPVASSWTN